jgi:hypothetical protein
MPNETLLINTIKIIEIRGYPVIPDRELAKLYGVSTKVLNQAVKRNAERFPDRYMFQLTASEFNIWKSQIVTSIGDRMGLRKAPFVFTEHGVAKLAPKSRLYFWTIILMKLRCSNYPKEIQKSNALFTQKKYLTN